MTEWIEVGARYCVVHDGLMNDDDWVCDFSHADPEPNDEGEPRPCDGRVLYYKKEDDRDA